MELQRGLQRVQKDRVVRVAVLRGQVKLTAEHAPHQLEQQGLFVGEDVEE